MKSNTPVYTVHLPTGKVITCHGGDDLDKIISLNVVRVYQSRQIRITVEYPTTPPKAREAINSDNRQKTKDFRLRLTKHELDCSCFDCREKVYDGPR